MPQLLSLCITLLGLILMARPAAAADRLSLSSPDGTQQMYFYLTDRGEPTYELHYKGRQVIRPSRLGL